MSKKKVLKSLYKNNIMKLCIIIIIIIIQVNINETKKEPKHIFRLETFVLLRFVQKIFAMISILMY